tara:strand:- start:654 stop:1091 length:438 start_codon:yes stop_codon:yes gene_type:complete
VLRIKQLLLGLSTISLLAPVLTSAEVLTINISEVQVSKGNIMIQIANSEEGWKFPEDSFPPVAQIMEPAQKGEMAFQTTLPAGTYAVQVMHDEDADGEMDTNFVGIPKEPFGFSNNVMGKMSPPKWKDAKFEIAGDASIEIFLKN